MRESPEAVGLKHDLKRVILPINPVGAGILVARLNGFSVLQALGRLSVSSPADLENYCDKHGR